MLVLQTTLKFFSSKIGILLENVNVFFSGAAASSTWFVRFHVVKTSKAVAQKSDTQMSNTNSCVYGWHGSVVSLNTVKAD